MSDLTAIQARYQAALDAKPGKGPIDPGPLWDSACDVPDLLVEIDRLTQELSNLPQNATQGATGGEKHPELHPRNSVLADGRLTTPEELDALPDGTLIEASGDYLNGKGSFTNCWARPVPEFITGGGERLWEVLVHGEATPANLTHATIIRSARILYRPDRPTGFESIDVDELARVLHSWDVEGGPCDRSWEGLTEAQREVWTSGAETVKSWLTGGVL